MRRPCAGSGDAAGVAATAAAASNDVTSAAPAHRQNKRKYLARIIMSDPHFGLEVCCLASIDAGAKSCRSPHLVVKMVFRAQFDSGISAWLYLVSAHLTDRLVGARPMPCGET